MYNYAGKTALITGASSGIGAAFARALAARGVNLVLVARSEESLKEQAEQLSRGHGIRAEVIVADLSQPGAGQSIYRQTGEMGIKVGLLVNNAGFSTYGSFETIQPEKDRAAIMVNAVAPVELAHAFIPDMLQRGEGAIINVASTAGFFPLAHQVVYAATKAFVLSFSEGLYVEYRKKGIQVFTLCPGAVASGFMDNMNVTMSIQKATPDWVVNAALKAFDKGKPYLVPGPVNYLSANLMPRLLPRAFMARLMGFFTLRIVKPR